MQFKKSALGLLSIGLLSLSLTPKPVAAFYTQGETAVRPVEKEFLTAAALTREEISEIAKQITVLIDGQNPGSGIIIAKEGTTYYILTAKHVVETEDEYTIQTPDGRRYPLDYSKVIKSPDTDLAIISFESTADYEVATLGDSSDMTIATEVHIYGFPHTRKGIFTYEDGTIFAFPSVPLKDGYQLVYSNATTVGMSGGPILNNDGKLVGIHGRGLPDTLNDRLSQKMASLGIPINTFHRFLIQTGLDIDPVEEAIAVLNQPNSNRSSSNSDEFETWLAKGVESLLLASDYEAAVRNFDRALVINPDNAVALTYRGISLAELGRYEDALASFDRALEIDSNSVMIWNMRGISLGELGRYEDALASFDRVLKIDPNDAFAWTNRGVSLANLGRYQEAITNYDQAIKIDPNYAAAWNHWGISLANLGRDQEAITNYDQAIKIDPNYAAAWINRCLRLYNLGYYQDVIDSCDRGISINPNNSNNSIAWYYRASALGHLERYQDAVDSYDKAISINSNDSRFWYYRANALRGYL